MSKNSSPKKNYDGVAENAFIAFMCIQFFIIIVNPLKFGGLLKQLALL